MVYGPQNGTQNLTTNEKRRQKSAGYKLAGDVTKMPGSGTPGDRSAKALEAGTLNKMTTERTLSRALGGDAKVLKIQGK